MTKGDYGFFLEKSKEVGFEETDAETVEMLYSAVYDALHHTPQEIISDRDGVDSKYYIEDDAIIFDYGAINPQYAINILYLLEQFGIRFLYNEKTNSYKIFFKK